MESRIGYTNQSDCYDASSEQVECYHYHKKLSPDKPHQIITLEVNLENPEIAAIEKALEWLVARHESLRTVFCLIEGVVKQCVVPYSKEIFSLAYYDVSNAGNKKDIISNIVSDSNNLLKKLDTPPLFRCCLFKSTENNYIFFLLIHHIISDGWSMSIIYKELTTAYERFKSGNSITIAPLEMQLKDYALWQKNWLARNGESIRNYWKEKLHTFKDELGVEAIYKRYAAYTGLPPDDNPERRKIETGEQLSHILNNSKGAVCYKYIGVQEKEQLTLLAAKCNCSIVNIVNASLQLLWYFLTGREKMLVATYVGSRFAPGAGALIGSLGGGAYLYQPIDREASIRNFIDVLYVEFLEAAGHLIFHHGDMKVNGYLTRLHCDFYFNFIKNWINNDDHAPEIQEGHSMRGGSDFYALCIYVSMPGDRLLFEWRYNCDLFSRELMDFIVSRYMLVLEMMSNDPGMPVKDLMYSLREKQVLPL